MPWTNSFGEDIEYLTMDSWKIDRCIGYPIYLSWQQFNKSKHLKRVVEGMCLFDPEMELGKDNLEKFLT